MTDESVPLDDLAVKHLEFIQAIIGRLAGNSFLMKGWALTLAAALYAVSFTNSNVRLALVSLLPVLSFWALDGYFLHREQLFRALYDAVRTRNPLIQPFQMSYRHFIGGQCTYWRALFSPTLSAFYGVLLVAAVLLALATGLHWPI